PSRPYTVPRGIDRLTPSTARTSPKCTTTSRTSTIGSGTAVTASGGASGRGSGWASGGCGGIRAFSQSGPVRTNPRPSCFPSAGRRRTVAPMRPPRSRVLVATVALLALVPAVGHAVPDELVAELESAEAELADLDAKVSLAVEEYNVAAAQLEQVEAQHAETTARVETLSAEAEQLEARTAAYVRSMYMRGPTTDLTVALETAEVTDAGRDLALMGRL